MAYGPFANDWTGSETKLDLHGIYERGDVIGTFPLRRHAFYVSKGWTYVALASREDVQKVGASIRAQGWTPEQVLAQYEPTEVGAFDIKTYLRVKAERQAVDYADLQKLVDEHGIEAVTSIRRQVDPSFVMPAAVVEKGKRGKAERVA